MPELGETPGDAQGPVRRVETDGQGLSQAPGGGEGTGSPGVNLDALAERVMALLKRELWIERERAGRG